MRRKALFEAARADDCNVVAYAHHADDAAQTTLLNLVWGGVVRSLAPSSDYFDGSMRLIRPLIYLREKDLHRYARLSAFPPPPAACARDECSRRALVASWLGSLGGPEREQARTNLLRAGLSGLEELG